MPSPKNKASKKSKGKSKAKPKIKKSKPKELFKNDPAVLLKIEELKKLHKNKNEIENSIKEIIDTFNNKTINEGDAEHFLDRLPLNSLKEIQEFQAGKKRETNLSVLNLRAQLRKDRTKKVEELRKIEEQISELEKDLLLAKINCVMNNLKEE